MIILVWQYQLQVINGKDSSSKIT